MIIIVCEAERQFPHITDFCSPVYLCRSSSVLSMMMGSNAVHFCAVTVTAVTDLNATVAHERTHLRSLIAIALKTVIM